MVDNASTDGTAKAIEKKFPKVKIIKNKKNVGYAKANNQGLGIVYRKDQDELQDRYVLFLNSDTIILNRAIEKCVKRMQDNEKIDVLGCQLLNKDRSIQPSGGFFPNLRQIFYWMFFIDNLPVVRRFLKAYQETRSGFFKKTKELDWVTGAFILAKKGVFDKIDGFDKDFFMYAEEVELLYRVKKAGFRVFFWPKAKIVHLRGESSQKAEEKAILGEYEGLVKFYRKHKSNGEEKILRLFLKAGALFRIIIFGILGDKEKKYIYEKAYRLAG